MSKLLQVDFDFNGPFGKEMTDALYDLAESINQEPGFIWKIWTEDEINKRAGGIYIFENIETAEAYLNKHENRLTKMGVKNINSKIFDVNEDLSKINKFPISSLNS